jgi:lipoyl(octanoyl) transferase
MSDIEIKISESLVAYDEALGLMEARVEDIIQGKEKELIWFLEHPPVYTAGTSAQDSELLDANNFPVYHTGRGGKFTYHGPGQLVAYFLLDLKKRAAPHQPDLKQYVRNLEELVIQTLESYGIKAERREGRVGLWVADNVTQEAKIAAIGIRVRKWVTYHGIAININPDLNHFKGIIPCGISQYGVTSLKAMGHDISAGSVRKSIKQKFYQIFGK